VSWTNHKIRRLGGLPKSIFTAALDINDNNQIVGESIFSYGEGAGPEASLALRRLA
jgi:uncharacterized membrane protein